MSKGLYHQVYHSRVEATLSACETISTLSHPGEKGRIREILIQQLFRPLLPSDLGIGSGFIVSSNGEVSCQHDIVIYDKAILPPILFDLSTGFFPIESVLYSIEIKSKLTRQELKSSHIAAQYLARLPLLGIDGKFSFDGPRPISSVFALGSDLKDVGQSETERYNRIRNGEPAFISVICVVGRGYWWQDDGVWRDWPEKHHLSEVIGMLGGIMNSLPRMYEQRRTARPPFGTYLIDFGADISRLLGELKGLEEQLKLADQSDSDKIGCLKDSILTARERVYTIQKVYNGEDIENLLQKILTYCEHLEQQLNQLTMLRK